MAMTASVEITRIFWDDRHCEASVKKGRRDVRRCVCEIRICESAMYRKLPVGLVGDTVSVSRKHTICQLPVSAERQPPGDQDAQVDSAFGLGEIA